MFVALCHSVCACVHSQAVSNAALRFEPFPVWGPYYPALQATATYPVEAATTTTVLEWLESDAPGASDVRRNRDKSWRWCSARTSHWWLAQTRCRWVIGQCSVNGEVQQDHVRCGAHKWVQDVCSRHGLLGCCKQLQA